MTGREGLRRKEYTDHIPPQLSPFFSGPQDYRKFWAGLQGLAICFYNSNRDLQVRKGMQA